jgi:hypothetical protein
MIRTVPNSGNEEIELYIRTYYSLLRSSDAIKIQSLVESHAATDSSLHVKPYDHDPTFPPLFTPRSACRR